jgi:hypothetical protein
MDLANDPLPLSPEDWATVVNDAVAATGHGDEVVVGVESTVDAWKVTVNPAISLLPTPPDPE